MPIEHQPHATATFFELAIALSALAWRTISSINHIAKDSARQKTDRISKQLKGDLDNIMFVNTRTVLKWLTISISGCSILGLVLFGTEWSPFVDSALFWIAFGSFIGGLCIAAWSESEKMRHYNKSEHVAAKPLEPFITTGE